jgi:hypothetical protein
MEFVVKSGAFVGIRTQTALLRQLVKSDIPKSSIDGIRLYTVISAPTE